MVGVGCPSKTSDEEEDRYEEGLPERCSSRGKRPYDAERAKKPDAALAATEADLEKIATSVASGRLRDPGKIGLRVGRVLSRHKMAKHFEVAIGGGCFSFSAKTATRRRHDGRDLRPFQGLLDHLATLTRNTCEMPGTTVTFDRLAEPTETQRKAFELIDVPILLRLV